jgi:hypothetical protein
MWQLPHARVPSCHDFLSALSAVHHGVLDGLCQVACPRTAVPNIRQLLHWAPMLTQQISSSSRSPSWPLPGSKHLHSNAKHVATAAWVLQGLAADSISSSSRSLSWPLPGSVPAHSNAAHVATAALGSAWILQALSPGSVSCCAALLPVSSRFLSLQSPSCQDLLSALS